MGNSRGAFLAMVMAVCLCSMLCSSLATDVSYDGRAIKINGQRRVLFSGSIHYPRSTPEMWPDLIRKAKEGGLDAVETYIFWNAHEPRRREYDFEGNHDLVRFIKEIQNAGLYAVLRIGPYACAEWNYGGFPAWLRQIPRMELRTDNQPFKDEMQNFTTYIVNLMKQERLFAPQGGPIILTQIENEYGNIMGPYGEAGKSYIKWCANMAVSQNVGVPWIMCQQNDAPEPMINTCNGFYCDWFTPNSPNSPKMWTENWVGWFKAWDKADPHRPAEDVAYAVARFFERGGTFNNYYMYHGGTNFGRTSGGPYITTTYDYDAPLDEYGNLRQPKYGHLKELHAAIKLMEKALTDGFLTNTTFGNGAWATKYSGDGITPGCFLVNTNSSANTTVTFEGNNYTLPAWSISILPDCTQEIYNTAKVTTQTSIMTRKPSQADEGLLNWSFRPEKIRDTLKGRGTFSANQLQEQIITTVDASDYLWYMTSVDFAGKDQRTLRVNTTGHVLHAFVNGRLVGSQYAPNGGFQFVFEGETELKPGNNIIALLSGTVGLKNYGARFELVPAGIVGGPVQLIGSGNSTIDLSSNQWTYKVGLNGERQKLYLDEPDEQQKWRANELPTKRPFTWYKATFEAPLGTDPVVVDLLGMGKGHAWVNGQSIGRFWPNYTVGYEACGQCDYRGVYDADRSKCRTGCGQPAQRWYHIPRSFLKPGKANTLVLFEEAGGDPMQVNFQTVTVGSTCAEVPKGKTLSLTCQGGQTISNVTFASFGNPVGYCGLVGEPFGTWGKFQKGSCDVPGAQSVVEKICIGQESCSIEVSEEVLGKSDCGEGVAKVLAVQASC